MWVLKRATHLAAIVVELLRKRIAIPAELRLKFHNGAREIFFNESGNLSYRAPALSVALPNSGKFDACGILIEHVYETLKKVQ